MHSHHHYSKSLWKKQRNNRGVKIDEVVLDILKDDLNILGEDKESVKQNTKTLINKAKTIGLVINEEKTKVMEKTTSEDVNLAIKNYVFEKTQKLSI